MKSTLVKWARLFLSSSREFFLHFFYNTSPCDLARYCKNNEEKIPGRSWEISAPIKRYGFRKRWGRFGLQRKSESIRSFNFKIFYYADSYVQYLRFFFVSFVWSYFTTLLRFRPLFCDKGGSFSRHYTPTEQLGRNTNELVWFSAFQWAIERPHRTNIDWPSIDFIANRQ